MIIKKNLEEISKMRKAGQLAADVLIYIAPFVKEGISTEQLLVKSEISLNERKNLFIRELKPLNRGNIFLMWDEQLKDI